MAAKDQWSLGAVIALPSSRSFAACHPEPQRLIGWAMNHGGEGSMEPER
jgi:hypothetical protein